MSSTITITIPVLLDLLFVWPILLYRWLKFGCIFRKINLGENVWTILDLKDYYRLNHFKWCVAGDDAYDIWSPQ